MRVATSESQQLTSDVTLDVLVSRGNERVGGLNFGISLLDQIAEEAARSNDRNRDGRLASSVDQLFSLDDPLA